MANPSTSAPQDGNYRSIIDVIVSPGTGLVLPQGGATVTTDTVSGQQYAPLVTQAVAPSSVSGTLQSAAAATGAGTALSVLGNSSIQFTVTGTFVGTITWQGSEDGTNYSSMYAVQLGTNTIATTATTTGTFESSISGLQKVQANVTAYTSGSITVTAHAIPGSFSPRVTNIGNIVQWGGVAPIFGGADAQASANVPVDGILVYNGTTWDRLKGDNTGAARSSLYVKTTTAGDTALALGQGAMAASLPVTIANNQGAIGSVVAQAVAGTALGADQTNSILKTSLYVKTSAAADTVLTLGQGAMAASVPVTMASNQSNINVAPQSIATGGATYFHLASAATTNATVVKASAGTLYQITVTNATANLRYVKFYDASSAPTAGAGTIVYVVGTPNISTGATVTISFPTGLAFATGIAFVTVTTLADSGSTAVGAGDLSIDLAYK